MRTTGIVAFGAALAASMVAGCTTDAQYMQQLEPKAVQTAVNRGKFEMNCQQVTGEVISKDMLQPAIQGFYARGGPERAEYTIGVAGCGERATYMVICPLDQTGCWSAGARNVIR
ncbi:MAG TPA: hypothetical protein VMK32_01795 [Burkholderiaceae bacterium]|nr:hypothetical protein [Burkholderiaceae bacterium]